MRVRIAHYEMLRPIGRDGAAMLRAVGEDAAAADGDRFATGSWADLERSLAAAAKRLGTQAIPAGPRRRIDPALVGSLVACEPLGLLSADDERIQATVETVRERFMLADGRAFFQGISHTGLGTYLTLQIAAVELAAGDRRCLDRLAWMLEVATPTWTWPEAVHPRLAGGCMGDGHHGWAADGDMPAPGFNYRLSDVLCALGILQLEELEELLRAELGCDLLDHRGLPRRARRAARLLPPVPTHAHDASASTRSRFTRYRLERIASFERSIRLAICSKSVWMIGTRRCQAAVFQSKWSGSPCVRSRAHRTQAEKIP